MQAMLPPLFQPLPRSPRPDAETSKVVEMGVRLQQSHGRAFASEFLVRRSIPVPVILRVLNDPPGRRRTNRLPLGA
jgi:hypothetical protein